MYILWEEKDIIRQKRHFLMRKQEIYTFRIFFQIATFSKTGVL